uniref:Uncharacterized protein n=1 Tax=Rhizophora mucronata TaxID=61149 RepID=A0A2P2PPE7_RHIMU
MAILSIHVNKAGLSNNIVNKQPSPNHIPMNRKTQLQVPKTSASLNQPQH